MPGSRGCSSTCWVNAVSTLLREWNVEPYIWMQANLKRLFREMKDAEGGLGVLRRPGATGKVGEDVDFLPRQAALAEKLQRDVHGRR